MPHAICVCVHQNAVSTLCMYIKCPPPSSLRCEIFKFTTHFILLVLVWLGKRTRHEIRVCVRVCVLCNIMCGQRCKVHFVVVSHKQHTFAHSITSVATHIIHTHTRTHWPACAFLALSISRSFYFLPFLFLAHSILSLFAPLSLPLSRSLFAAL